MVRLEPRRCLRQRLRKRGALLWSNSTLDPCDHSSGLDGETGFEPGNVTAIVPLTRARYRVAR